MFSEPVKTQLMGWSGFLIVDRPDTSVAYNDFTYNVDKQPGFSEYSFSFGIQKAGGAQVLYKATYSTDTEKWTLAEITAP